MEQKFGMKQNYVSDSIEELAVINICLVEIIIIELNCI